MPAFIKGRELSRAYFAEAVAPVVAAEFPGLRYGAALLGGGSEVLGFDTELSTDHDWGPRVDLFVHEDALAAVRDRLDAALRRALPGGFRGYPTQFAERGAGAHEITITTPRRFVRDYLGFDFGPDVGGEVAPADWLTFPEQKLRTLTAGPIFRDEVGLGEIRARLAYYPRDVWRYLLAAGWARVGEEEALMGRAGSVGDEVGSAVIGARLVRDVMRLAFLMERTYAPYPKWFGTAFARLRSAPALLSDLEAALAARSWREREACLVRAYGTAAAMHNALELTDPLPTAARDFFGRPFRVVALHGFAEALLARVEDERVRRLAARPLIGSLDQFSDSTALVSHPEWRAALRAMYL